MKDKGFTLVELLSVLVLLAIICIILLPIVNNIVSGSEDTIYEKQLNTILNATYDWSLKNINYLPTTDKKTYVTLGLLKKYGFVSNDIKDPTTNKMFSNDLVISISNVGTNYNIKNNNSMKSGNYLYTIEFDLMSSEDYENNKPTIVLDDLQILSDGNYTTKINVGNEFENATFKATSSTGVDLTDRVIINIILNDKIVSLVDTSRYAIYHINYTVVDDNGYSTTIVRNVIIVDEEVPVLTIPTENTISTNITSFDLLEGVICDDNSGNCNITTNGTLTLGTPGKYIIEYIAKDPAGNIATTKRVITIE